MKNRLLHVLTIALTATLLAGCISPAASNTSSAETSQAQLQKIVVGASPTPHAEILEAAKEVLAEKGYELVIKEFVDYVQPNVTLVSKEIDANFFQTQPFLDNFNSENQADLVTATTVHYEPMGVYPGKLKSLDDLKEGSVVAIPNDTTNEARALYLLQAQGLLKLKEGAGLTTTINDILENPRKIQFKEIEAAQIPRSLPDVDAAVINGNYALEARLNVGTDALAKEDEHSLGAEALSNNIVVRAGDEEREEIKALVEAMNSPEVKKFIEEKYQGAVVPVF